MLATMKAHEGDVVELVEDLPRVERRRGDRGIVIEAFDQPSEAYDIEFEDADGEFLGFAYSVKPDQIANIDAIAQAAYASGIALLESGMKLDGRRKLREAVLLKPVVARYLLNSVLESFGASDDFNGLIDALRFVCQLNPSDELPRTNLVSAYLNRGIQEARKGNVEGALLLFYPAMGFATTDETVSWVRQNLAAGHTSLAVQAQRRARGEAEPEAALQHLKAALNNMARACAINPSEHTRKNLGLAYALVGNGLLKSRAFETAAEFFAVAEDAGLSFPWLHNNHGVALASSCVLDGAMEQFERALELDPDHAASQINVVQVQQAREDGGAARFSTVEIRDLLFQELPMSQTYAYQAAA